MPLVRPSQSRPGQEAAGGREEIDRTEPIRTNGSARRAGRRMNGTMMEQQHAESVCRWGRGARGEAGPQACQQRGVVHLLRRESQLHQPGPLVHGKQLDVHLLWQSCMCAHEPIYVPYLLTGCIAGRCGGRRMKSVVLHNQGGRVLVPHQDQRVVWGGSRRPTVGPALHGVKCTCAAGADNVIGEAGAGGAYLVDDARVTLVPGQQRLAVRLWCGSQRHQLLQRRPPVRQAGPAADCASHRAVSVSRRNK